MIQTLDYHTALVTPESFRRQHLLPAIWRESAKMTRYLQLIRGLYSLILYFDRGSPHISRLRAFPLDEEGACSANPHE
jgi:hypothetical protein